MEILPLEMSAQLAACAHIESRGSSLDRGTVCHYDVVPDDDPTSDPIPRDLPIHRTDVFIPS